MRACGAAHASGDEASQIEKGIGFGRLRERMQKWVPADNIMTTEDDWRQVGIELAKRF